MIRGAIRGGRRCARPGRRGRAGLPLSRDHQPLQPAVHHLPAHLRGAGTAGRHELGAVHQRSSTSCRNIARVVLHGVGEPMMVKDLPRMVRYLKDRGTYVLFNTNGTLLTERKGRELIDSRPRRAARLARCRRADDLQGGARARTCSTGSCATCARFTAMQRELGPRDAARLAVADRAQGDDRAAARLSCASRSDIGVGGGLSAAPRLFDRRAGAGAARIGAVRAAGATSEGAVIREAEALARELGDQLQRLGRRPSPATASSAQRDEQPWSLCRRPWTLMYFTAHGRALPCCIAPFSQRGYDSYTLGDATQQTLREIWNGDALPGIPRGAARAISRRQPAPTAACAGACERRIAAA